MFQSVVGSVKENHNNGSNSGRLLRDIEEISKALYLNRVSSNRSKSSGRYTKIKFANEELFDEEKKPSSLWKNWKPFKALTHIRSHRFYCHFFLHVHTIEDIPSSLNNAYLCVNWIRKEKELQTRPAPVSQGFAEFEETLVFRCPVYGSKNRHHHSTKYEAKPFLLSVSVIGDPSLETGKHWVDLTRLLPPTMDELEVEKNLGKWTTSFRLTGKAKGAVLNVSFGFAVMGRHPFEQSANMNIFRLLHENSSTLNVQLPNQGTELAQSITSLYEKLDEGKSEQQPCIDESYVDNSGNEFFSGEFTVIDCGIEFSRIKSLRSEDRNESFDGYSVKTINLKDIFDIDDPAPLTESTEIKRDNFVVDSSDADDSLRQQNPRIGIQIESESPKMERSRSLDDITESDFLKLLGIDQNTLESGYETEPHSPKERLVLFDVDQIEEQLDFEEHKNDNTSLISRRNAKMLEVMETKALMVEWNLDEKFFLGSPSISSGGFGSPIYIPSIDVPLEFPPIAEGLDSFLETKDGGFLRSMNPCLFKEAKNGGRLIMQVSVPVVLPVVMGSSIMEILEHWASVGNQKMQMQMNKLMPLEDLTGKKMEEMAWNLASKQEAIKRRLSSLNVEQQEEDGENESSFDYVLDELILNSQFSNDMDSDLIALKDVAPLTMDKIEALTIQGLRIQSGLSDEEAPSTIRPQSIGNNVTFLNKGHLLCFDEEEEEEDSNKAQLNEEHNDIDHLINLSITLDEWLRLDSGLFDEITDTSEILAAHMAENVGHVDEILTKSRKNESCGFLGNNLTVAMRVQLRNPLRDYETVGTPMVAFIEVERVYIDLKPKILSLGEQSESDDQEDNHQEEFGIGTPLFKIREVHVAGFKTLMETNEKCFWERRRRGEQQSGSRWLIAAGMGKKKVFSSKSNAIVKSSLSGMTNGVSVDSLWSISAHVHGLRARWKELATLNHHMRNPDVVFMC
ncbi:protein PLASTID MOVEMENT IMPAIRED 1-RELATED 1-like isoform X2 [Impatiens glandulifera]|uniref:protein PLASTID MOVEMENT IMPAIRED 1-RELATED 1-like isoform X2 n=1 Tax=Impatiens glandulifera TaxID=253017 RepID=UPI001FB09FBD|nr:protein PLASTID MOVEMENT IMPAIRED 1-RELATED 1-like isoform X2 [Impatiens glandulifera]